MNIVSEKQRSPITTVGQNVTSFQHLYNHTNIISCCISNSFHERNMHKPLISIKSLWLEYSIWLGVYTFLWRPKILGQHCPWEVVSGLNCIPKQLLCTTLSTYHSICRINRRQKGGDLTQSYDKNPYTNRNVKRASDNTNNATKKFD